MLKVGILGSTGRVGSLLIDDLENNPDRIKLLFKQKEFKHITAKDRYEKHIPVICLKFLYFKHILFYNFLVKNINIYQCNLEKLSFSKFHLL
jgi:hypothetical protein